VDTCNAYISILDESALARARWLDTQDPSLRPLHGIPIAVKDNIAVQGCRLTCGSRMLSRHKAPFSATAVRRLEAAGAVIVAKTNMDEFGMGSSGEYSAFGPVTHPVNSFLSAGGSSAGSAVAVAKGDVPIALGSDTGGSVRQPAAFCGIPAIRPTYGTVSRFGLVAFASSMDQIGPMTTCVDDLKTVLGVISGHDPLDVTSQNTSRRIHEPEKLPETNRVATVRNIETLIREPLIRKGMDRVLKILAGGFTIADPVTGGDPEELLSAYYVISSAEASSNLARYDGIRFGGMEEKSPEQMFSDTIRNLRSRSFGPEVQRRILAGTAYLSSGFHDELYHRAVTVKHHFQKTIRDVFTIIDLLVLPTTPTLPFQRGVMTGDPVSMYASDIFTVMASLAGCPALNLPVRDPAVFPADMSAGTVPPSIQLIAAPYREDLLFQAARFLEESWR